MCRRRPADPRRARRGSAQAWRGKGRMLCGSRATRPSAIASRGARRIGRVAPLHEPLEEAERAGRGADGARIGVPPGTSSSSRPRAAAEERLDVRASAMPAWRRSPNGRALTPTRPAGARTIRHPSSSAWRSASRRSAAGGAVKYADDQASRRTGAGPVRRWVARGLVACSISDHFTMKRPRRHGERAGERGDLAEESSRGTGGWPATIASTSIREAASIASTARPTAPPARQFIIRACVRCVLAPAHSSSITDAHARSRRAGDQASPMRSSVRRVDRSPRCRVHAPSPVGDSGETWRTVLISSIYVLPQGTGQFVVVPLGRETVVDRKCSPWP